VRFDSGGPSAVAWGVSCSKPGLFGSARFKLASGLRSPVAFQCGTLHAAGAWWRWGAWLFVRLRLAASEAMIWVRIAAGKDGANQGRHSHPQQNHRLHPLIFGFTGAHRFYWQPHFGTSIFLFRPASDRLDRISFTLRSPAGLICGSGPAPSTTTSHGFC
jgi:hypothetical protein